MARIKTPVVLDHGLTADMDWEGDTPCVHIKGVDLKQRPLALRLTSGQLALLQAVVLKASQAGERAKEPA